MDSTPVILFAQKLAGNEKRIRDRAVKKLKKWLYARSSSVKFQFTKEEILKLWKGLFYCMWMSDKPLIQEELAKTLSEMIHCFNKRDAALLFIQEFYETVNREWPRLDYLRMDKFMMFVRRFLHQTFEFLHKSGWDEELKEKVLEILNTAVINPKKEDACMGFQMHFADIYVEELVKVAADELSGQQLTRFLVPYCHLLASSRSPGLRKTVIQRVFEFTMRLSESDEVDGSDSNDKFKNGGDEDDEGSNNEDCDDEADVESEDDESVSLDEDDEAEYRQTIYSRFEGEQKFMQKVKKHEIENLKLPIPEFDYQDIGDTLLEIVGNAQMKQKLRSENYFLVKEFHEMAKGIFPLDLVDKSLGRRLSKRDIEAAAKRLLMEREEEMLEDASIKRQRRSAFSDLEKADISESESDSEHTDGAECIDVLIESQNKKRGRRQEQMKKNEKQKSLKRRKLSDDAAQNFLNEQYSTDETCESAKNHENIEKYPEPEVNAVHLSSEVKKKSINQNVMRQSKKQKCLKTKRKISTHSNLLPVVGSAKDSFHSDIPVEKGQYETVKVSEKVNEKEDCLNHEGMNIQLNSEDKAGTNLSPLMTKAKPTRKKGTLNKLAAKDELSGKESNDIKQAIDGTKLPKTRTADTSISEQKMGSTTSSFVSLELTSVTDQDSVLQCVAVQKSGDASNEQLEERLSGSGSKGEKVVQSSPSHNKILTRNRKKVALKGSLLDKTDECGSVDESSRKQLHKMPTLEIVTQNCKEVENQLNGGDITEDNQSEETGKSKNETPQKTETRLINIGSVNKSNKDAVMELNSGDSNEMKLPKNRNKSRKNIKRQKTKLLQNKTKSMPVLDAVESTNSSYIRLKTGNVTDTNTVPVCDAVKISGDSPVAQDKNKKLVNDSKSENIVKSSPSRNIIMTRKRKKDSLQVSKLNITEQRVNENENDHFTDGKGNLKSPEKKRIKLTTLIEGGEFKKLSQKKVTGNDFIKFEEFVKTPPAFFRKAVSKVSPKFVQKLKKEEFQSKEELTKSCKKVNFKLINNSTQGAREYAVSVKNSPGIPYDAKRQPSQGVLKLRLATDSNNDQANQKSS